MIGQSRVWDEPMSVLIRRLIKKYNLTWLRHETVHHRFQNLTETFQGDLAGKLMKGIVDQEGEPLPCNCNAQTKSEDGKCIYNGLCRVQMTIYDLKCKITGKSYIGKTQRHLKTRTSKHFADVFKLLEAKQEGQKYKQVDAFAKHFAELCKDCNLSNKVKAKLKKIVEISIIWT